MFSKNKAVVFLCIFCCSLFQLSSTYMFTYLDISKNTTLYINKYSGDPLGKRYVLSEIFKRSIPIYISTNIAKGLILYYGKVRWEIVFIVETLLTIFHSCLATYTYNYSISAARDIIPKRFAGDYFQIGSVFLAIILVLTQYYYDTALLPSPEIIRLDKEIDQISSKLLKITNEKEEFQNSIERRVKISKERGETLLEMLDEEGRKGIEPPFLELLALERQQASSEAFLKDKMEELIQSKSARITHERSLESSEKR